MYEYYESTPLDESFMEFVRELWGDEGVAIVSFLSENFDVTDEMLSQKTGIKLNDVRKILYSLFDNQLVSYKRIRDKSTGWFIYLWRLNKDNVEYVINTKKRAVLEKLKERYKYETQHVFLHCPKDNNRYSFEEALENGFKCSVCGGNLETFNNSLIIQFLERKIKELEEDISKSQS
ncbi:MAG: transcription factor [Candidatus Methanomethylicia archaeon]